MNTVVRVDPHFATQAEALTTTMGQVMENDIVGMSGHFGLNIFKQMLIYNILISARSIGHTCANFSLNCLTGEGFDQWVKPETIVTL